MSIEHRLEVSFCREEQTKAVVGGRWEWEPSGAESKGANDGE